MERRRKQEEGSYRKTALGGRGLFVFRSPKVVKYPGIDTRVRGGGVLRKHFTQSRGLGDGKRQLGKRTAMSEGAGSAGSVRRARPFFSRIPVPDNSPQLIGAPPCPAALPQEPTMPSALGGPAALVARRRHRPQPVRETNLTNVSMRPSFPPSATPRDQIEALSLDDKIEWLRQHCLQVKSRSSSPDDAIAGGGRRSPSFLR